MTKVSMQKRVNEGVRVLTAVYGTRKVWGIGPRAIENAYDPRDAIFERLGTNFSALTLAVDEVGVADVKRLKRLVDEDYEVDGSALGFYPIQHTKNYEVDLQELKDIWIAKLREMRAESIGSAPERKRFVWTPEADGLYQDASY